MIFPPSKKGNAAAVRKNESAHLPQFSKTNWKANGLPNNCQDLSTHCRMMRQLTYPAACRILLIKPDGEIMRFFPKLSPGLLAPFSAVF
ncbi:MAG: hypothetical protein KBH92_11385, partial [Syntrophaceae bacterium]|nr:hypothetical protein [Syntrophaceae bacterium]